MLSQGFIKFRLFSFYCHILRIVFFSVKKNMDALISASTPLLLLVIGWKKLIHRKKNPVNPPLTLFSLSLLKDVCLKYCDLLSFIIFSPSHHRSHARGPNTDFYVTSHSLKHVLGCSATTDVFDMFSIFICYFDFQRRVQSACYFPGKLICFGFLVLLRGEPNLFYKQSLFYITETCVLTFWPRPFIYFLIQFPL